MLVLICLLFVVQTGSNRRSDVQTGSNRHAEPIEMFSSVSVTPPGDPLRFHAHFIAVCLPADESIPLLDILAVARLGSNVKKTVLLCSPEADGSVMYTSLQWSGMV